MATRIIKTKTDIDIKFIIYVRDIASYLCSNWGQQLLDHPNMTMPLEPYLLLEKDNAIHQPFKHILNLANHFHDSQIILRGFSPEMWHRKDVALDF